MGSGQTLAANRCHVFQHFFDPPPAGAELSPLLSPLKRLPSLVSEAGVLILGRLKDLGRLFSCAGKRRFMGIIPSLTVVWSKAK